MYDDRGYFSMPPGAILPGKLGAFSMYLKTPDSKFPVLFARAGEVVSPAVLQRLEDTGVREVFIRTEDKVNFDRYLEDHLELILNNTGVDLEKRTEVFTRVSISLIRESFDLVTREGITHDVTSRLEHMVRNTTVFLTRQNTLPVLSMMIGYDYDTYRHSMLVYWYTTALMHYCRDLIEQHIFEDFDEYLVKGGVAALLHDIGKTMIDPRIIKKPDSLSEYEYTIIKSHPSHAMAILLEIDIHISIKKAILHHHEDYNGNGYPFGLAGNDIPLLSRIIRITDVFEAITSRRPYKEAITPFQARTIMLGELSGLKPELTQDPRDHNASGYFDGEILHLFFSMLEENRVIEPEEVAP